MKSSLLKKYWMAATGLFLCLFLVGHLLGNLQLFISGEEGKLQFNAYAKFMTSNPLVKILSWLTYLSILFHAIDGVILTMKNRAARPVKYAYERADKNSIWSSRNMGILGTVLLVFIVTHMANFWAVMHFGDWTAAEMMDSNGNKDLHKIVMEFFQNPNYGLYASLLYVAAMAALSYHLIHGFKSAFQSFGLNHPRYNGLISSLGLGFALIVPALFALMPLYIYFSK